MSLRARATATALLAVVVAACGGTTATASPSASAAAPATPSAAASTEPSPSATEAASPSAAESAAASPDLSGIQGSVTALDKLSSYKIAMHVVNKDGATDITVVTVREPELANRFDLGTPDGKKVGIVVIGSKAWISQDGTTWVPTPSSTVTPMIASITPAALLGSFTASGDLNLLQAAGTETKNGVQATHYHVDSSTPLPPGATETIPPGASVDIWVAADGYLVAMEAQGLAGIEAGGVQSVTIETTNVNDPSLKVEPPA